jgi:hypothetical protein
VYCPNCKLIITQGEKSCLYCGYVTISNNIKPKTDRDSHLKIFLILESTYFYVSVFILFWLLLYLNQQALVSNYSSSLIDNIFYSFIWLLLPLITLSLWQLIYGSVFLFTIVRLKEMNKFGYYVKSLSHVSLGVILIVFINWLNNQTSTGIENFSINMANSSFWIFFFMTIIIVYLIILFVLSLSHIFRYDFQYSIQLILFIISLGWILEIITLIFIGSLYYDMVSTESVIAFKLRFGNNFGFIELSLLFVIIIKIAQGVCNSLILDKLNIK